MSNSLNSSFNLLLDAQSFTSVVQKDRKIHKNELSQLLFTDIDYVTKYFQFCGIGIQEVGAAL